MFKACFALFGHLCGNFMEIICLKALGNCSASILTYNFSISSWENPKTLISMIPGLWDVSPSSETNHFHLWRHQDTKQNEERSVVQL